MKNQQPRISIIIPARNEGARVVSAIRSFARGRSHTFPLEFVIVDDASDDNCCAGLENIFDTHRDLVTVKVLRLNVWSGIPIARNRGAFAATAPVLAITDANVVASPGWDIPVFRDLRPRRALCGVIADMASQWKGMGCTLEIPSMGTKWLSASETYNGFIPIMPEAATVIPADLFRQLGGYDTAMPVYGACEPEFSLRLWLSGAEIVAAPGIVYSHRFRPEGERAPFLKQIETVLIQNYLRFGLLYLNSREIVELFSHYASKTSPTHFQRALEAVGRGDVWQRREHLRQNLRYDFAWFRRRFGI